MKANGEYKRTKKYSLEVRKEKSIILQASRGSACVMPKESVEVGWHRKKQLAKMWTKKFITDSYITDVELFEYLMGEKTIRREKLLAIAGSFDRDEWEKQKEVEK